MKSKDIRTKAKELLESLKDSVITESYIETVNSKYQEFIQILKNDNLEQYLKVYLAYTDYEWAIHDELVLITKEFSNLINTCYSNIAPDMMQYKRTMARKTLEAVNSKHEETGNAT